LALLQLVVWAKKTKLAAMNLVKAEDRELVIIEVVPAE
jgi:hypothetical protein